MKKAVLVTVTFTTRILVDNDFDNDNIYDLSDKEMNEVENNIRAKVNNNETIENLEKIVDDTEFPHINE